VYGTELVIGVNVLPTLASRSTTGSVLALPEIDVMVLTTVRKPVRPSDCLDRRLGSICEAAAAVVTSAASIRWAMVEILPLPTNRQARMYCSHDILNELKAGLESSSTSQRQESKLFDGFKLIL